MILIITGGEPTEHPEFIGFLEKAERFYPDRRSVLILSNGSFLEDDNYTERILGFGYNIQVTNDDRFYPKRIKKKNYTHIEYIDRIQQVSPFGRALDNGIPVNQKYPACFNLRSFARHSMTFCNIIFNLRTTMKKFCTPSINTDGSFAAGETPFCRRFGTVNSTDEELLNNLKSISCNNCGLYKNLKGAFAEKWKELNNEKGDRE
jgi:hypothetical protein